MAEEDDVEVDMSVAEYWHGRLDDFERDVLPVFRQQGYSPNTALMAYMLDELDTAVMIAANAGKGQG